MNIKATFKTTEQSIKTTFGEVQHTNNNTGDSYTKAETNLLLAGKQDKLTFDDVPKQKSSNPVTSGGVYSELNKIKNEVIPTPTTAKVGQTIVVKEIDESGKPTKWETADVGGGATEEKKWKIIADKTTTEDVSIIEETFDEVSEIRVVFFCKLSEGSDTSKTTGFFINGINSGEFNYYTNNYRGHYIHVVYTECGTYGWKTTNKGEFVFYRDTRMDTPNQSNILISSIVDSGARTLRIKPFDVNTTYLAGARLIIIGR